MVKPTLRKWKRTHSLGLRLSTQAASLMVSPSSLIPSDPFQHHHPFVFPPLIVDSLTLVFWIFPDAFIFGTWLAFSGLCNRMWWRWDCDAFFSDITFYATGGMVGVVLPLRQTSLTSFCAKRILSAGMDWQLVYVVHEEGPIGLRSWCAILSWINCSWFVLKLLFLK